MDRFSAFFESKTQAQKALMVVGGAALFLLVLAILYIITTPPRSNTNQVQNSQAPQVTAIPIVNTNSFPSNKWKTENNPSYTIDYPSTWKRQELQVNTGGTLISLTSPYNTASEAFPRIDIQVTPTGTNITNLQRVENLAPLKLASSEASFKGQKAMQLTGILPFDFTVGNTIKKVNKTFLFFSANGKDYVIDYAYFQDENAQNSLQEINEALDSLTLQ